MSPICLAHSPTLNDSMQGQPTQSNFLEPLNERVSLAAKVESVHGLLREHLPFIDRIAADIYDRKTDLLETVVEISASEQIVANYQTRLEEASAVRAMLQSSRPNVMVHKLGRYRQLGEYGSCQKVQVGYASNCTMPMYDTGEFFGFLYFSSFESDVFDSKAIHTLDLFGHLISLAIINDISKRRILAGTLKAARTFTIQRDAETGSHVDRMAYYVWLIAKDLSSRLGLTDDYVEKLFLFAPLHDLGKIAIPDSILLKPGKLSPHEFEVMKTHTIRGRQLVDELIDDFALDKLDGVNTLRNIATFHHEALNGTGYPLGLKADEIPLEAKIVSVADVFDALTSKRPYKRALSNDEAFAMLDEMSGTKLDPECVRALANHRQEILKIQEMFGEDEHG